MYNYKGILEQNENNNLPGWSSSSIREYYKLKTFFGCLAGFVGNPVQGYAQTGRSTFNSKCAIDDFGLKTK